MTPLSDQPAHVEDERLAAYLDERLTPSERTWVVAHFADCEDCRRTMIAARRLMERQAHRRHSWGRSVPLLVAAVLAFALVPRFFSTPALQPTTSTGPAGQRAPQPEARSSVVIVEPRDRATVSGGLLVFRWQSAGVDATYRVVLQDSTGAPVWAATVADTSVALPSTTTLGKGQQYFWTVDAQLADGRPARGSVQRFMVQ